MRLGHSAAWQGSGLSPPAISHSGSAARPAAGRILYSEEGAELVPIRACRWAGELHHLQEVSILAASSLKLLNHCSINKI